MLHKTLRQLLVHPKDKREVKDMAGVVYSIPSKDYPTCTLGKQEVDSEQERKNIRRMWDNWKGLNSHVQKRENLSEIHQSALMNHAGRENHTVDWDNTTLPKKEADGAKRRIMEAIYIRKAGMHAINHNSDATNFWKSFPKYSAMTPSGLAIRF